ncbi:unnamed protein product [Pleuronectes platessa]|uniref:KHDRBS Qua1 domain-containing protein n=1 Tax=Pleuronectes platessa TaxID=8262 RepID=A0A9N7VX84_PLEPL|nr:unnamed protein product [Pleuronectes platessa]
MCGAAFALEQSVHTADSSALAAVAPPPLHRPTNGRQSLRAELRRDQRRLHRDFVPREERQPRTGCDAQSGSVHPSTRSRDKSSRSHLTRSPCVCARESAPERVFSVRTERCSRSANDSISRLVGFSRCSPETFGGVLTWSCVDADSKFLLLFFFLCIVLYLNNTRVAELEPEVQDDMESEKYLPELMAEKDTMDPSFLHSLRLLDQGKCPVVCGRGWWGVRATAG